MSTDFSPIIPFFLAALVVFAVYRRFRRSFGQQLLAPLRMKLRIGLFVLIGCLLIPAGLRSPAFSGAMVAGVIAGTALAVWGAARTRFLIVADKTYFVPHTYTGIAVSLLFVGRLAYRFVQLYGSGQAASVAGQGFGNPMFAQSGMMSSPLTLGLFFVLVGYYVCYYLLVLRKSAAHKPPPPAVASEAPPPAVSNRRRDGGDGLAE